MRKAALCSDTKDDGTECFEREFRELSAFRCAIPNDTTAHEFVSADGDVQAVADITDAEDENPTSGPGDVPNRLL